MLFINDVTLYLQAGFAADLLGTSEGGLYNPCRERLARANGSATALSRRERAQTTTARALCEPWKSAGSGRRAPKVATHKRKTRAACSQNVGIAALGDKEKGLRFSRKPLTLVALHGFRTADLWIMIPSL